MASIISSGRISVSYRSSVAPDLLELGGLGRHQQLEQVLAMVLVEPFGEAAQLLGLPLVHLAVALGVVADEHLGEVRVVLFDLLAELVAVLRSRTRSDPSFSTGIASL